jgi:hypothetical protein
MLPCALLLLLVLALAALCAAQTPLTDFDSIVAALNAGTLSCAPRALQFDRGEEFSDFVRARIF